MIKADDIHFHTPDDVRHDWAETGYFNFFIPEHNILGWTYFVHRAGIGATTSDVTIIDRWSTHIHEAVYINLTNHNPIAERADRFTLTNGASFHAKSLREYQIGFESPDVGLDLEYQSLMEPFDIHDKSMDPMAAEDHASAIANSGFGAAYASHFDMAVSVRGSLRLGQKTLPIDCVATMNHSWGPRPETGIHPILWLNAHFGKDYAIHGIFSYDKDGPAGQQHEFKHGYALIDGKVRGAVGGTAQAIREGIYAKSAAFTIVDIDGRVHACSGEMLNLHPWVPYGNNLGPVSLARWRTDGHDDGYGTYMEGFPLNTLRRDHA